jgi:hypothetical protein
MSYGVAAAGCNLFRGWGVYAVNMKRILVVTMVAGMLSAWTPALMAEVSTNSTGQTVTQTPTAQQRQADRRKLMKILGLDAKELKGLTPAERRTKIKDATDQKIALLEQQKADGTITADGQSDLAFLESYQHRGKAKTPKTDN